MLQRTKVRDVLLALFHIFLFPTDVVSAILGVSSDSPTSTFEIQNATWTEIHPDPKWKEKADLRIDQLRKNNITIRS